MNDKMNPSSHRGRNSVKLLGSLRGEGALLWSGAPAAVRYQLDVYEGRSRRTGSGSVDGDLALLLAAEAEEATLRLADGTEIPVALHQLDDLGALFEARGDVPAP